MIKFLSGALVGVLLTGGALVAARAYSPFLPDLRGSDFRKAIIAAEMAKHPEAQCSTFEELYVETGFAPGKGQIALWHVKCESGLIVGFLFDKEGKLVKAVPEGMF